MFALCWKLILSISYENDEELLNIFSNYIIYWLNRGVNHHRQNHRHNHALCRLG